MDEHYRRHELCQDLTDEQMAALAELAEEAGELAQAVGKTLKWGLKSCHPATPGLTNYVQITQEVSDIITALGHLQESYRG